MNREQMIAWLTLEGWEPKANTAPDHPTQYAGAYKGKARCTIAGEIFDPSEHWEHVQLASWHRYSDREIQNVYEAVANQVP